MPAFKDYIASDINNVFINPDEFGEPHIINGRELVVVIDNDQLLSRTKKEYDGITVGEILYYVSAKDYGPQPMIGEMQIFDDRPMEVFDAQNEDGIYEIILRGNE